MKNVDLNNQKCSSAAIKKSRLRGNKLAKIASILMENTQRIARRFELGMDDNIDPIVKPIGWEPQTINEPSAFALKNSLLFKIFSFVILSFICMESAKGQCYPDRHSTNANDGWVSCIETANPNATLGNSHWLLYNLGQVRNLYQTTFWNTNHPDHLAWGVKKMRFDYSVDSLNWSYLTTYNFGKASGHSLYEGEPGPNFDGKQVRYILLTPLENYGADCVGFSEMRFNIEPSPANELSLNLTPCLNQGIIYNINGGLNLGGMYAGTGVVNNYDDKFDFDPEAAGPGSHTITYQYTQGNGKLISKKTTIVVKNCGTANCPPCAPCGKEPQSTLNANPVPNGLFFKKPTLNSAGTIKTGSEVDYLAGQSVSLNNNFSVKKGASFKADIRECDPEPNLLVNGGFENGTAPWVIELHDAANATLTIERNNCFEGNACARVEVSSTTSTLWHIQFQQFGMSVDNGKSYTISFAARTNQPISVWSSLGRHNTPWNGYNGSTIDLTNQWQVFTFTVKPNESNIGQTRFAVMLSYQGTLPTTYWFDDLKMTLNE